MLAMSLAGLQVPGKQLPGKISSLSCASAAFEQNIGIWGKSCGSLSSKSRKSPLARWQLRTPWFVSSAFFGNSSWHVFASMNARNIQKKQAGREADYGETACQSAGRFRTAIPVSLPSGYVRDRLWIPVAGREPLLFPN